VTKCTEFEINFWAVEKYLHLNPIELKSEVTVELSLDTLFQQLLPRLAGSDASITIKVS